ncbi:Pentatricopeptide repeat-containing protein 5, mitochondrial [Vanrija pseudolonga]|uniref:Pentatricopeptide repeat-containing protein 5, mitochondrial n=1 Tax=Vanrija pseudolonga TaxID=143232 RepID=A0AAF1BIE9_9TREE|nr:Pentatricopeptide repeat-containing protein 5, mitochondrial [Vanrija pseudolonga]
MLNKAATHFRPLLRVSSHTHQPDLFTSNPSLLHHFQSANVGTSLVSQASNATQGASSGAAGGAGRAGYSGASSGGGYTGHARAFLSLPQGPNADASSISSSADEHKDARDRAQLALKQRISARNSDRKTEVRTVTVREQLSARAGSRTVVLREIEPAAPESSAKAQSSIAYPAWSALPADAAPGGALWVPGAAPSRQLGSRAFSTRARPAVTGSDEIVSRTPTPDANRIDQPNRVLMDLAGLDLSRPSNRTQLRRNSTHSVVRPAEVDAAVFDGRAADAVPSAGEQFFAALREASEKGEHETVARLVGYFRSDRSAGDVDPALASEYPIPVGYNTANYNMCIQATLALRGRGQSIAPILDMYNEMLERDVVPNMRTYQTVIRALCLREEDVAAASQRWRNGNDFTVFKAEKLGLASEDPAGEKAAAQAIAAYQSEDNLASAIKLYNVAGTIFRGGRRDYSAQGDILAAGAAAAGLLNAPTAADLKPIIKAALANPDLELDLYVPIFEILAGGNIEGVEVAAAWDAFEKNVARRLATKSPVSNGQYGRLAIFRVERDAASAAVRAFVTTGDVKTAEAIVDAHLKDSERGPRQSRNLVGALVGELARQGKVDSALKWNATLKDDIISPTDMYDLVEALAEAGRVAEAASFFATYNAKLITEQPGHKIRRYRLLKIYGIALAEATAAKTDADRNSILNATAELLTQSASVLDPQLLRAHVQLLLAARRFSDIGPLLNRFSARQSDERDASLREGLVGVVTSDAPIGNVLDAIRGFARLGEPIASAGDSVPIATLIVDKYIAGRSKVDAVTDLHLAPDAWFRLLESFVALPTADVEAGAADKALETFLTDLASFRDTRYPLPRGFATSPVTAELADILVSRFGIERSTALLTAAFGDKAAAAFLPTPEATDAASESTFTLPPTPQSSEAPPSVLQPPSAHTLHISQELVGQIDKLASFQPVKITPESVYETIRRALTQDNAVPTPEAIGRLISALARAGDEPKARELYSLAQVVLASCISEPVQQAEGWHAIEDAMIAACCFLGHLEQAGMHRARIIDAGMVPSADAYATMIASSRDSTDDALVARELFEESQSLGVVPNLYLYNTIISKLSKARKAEMALELFTQMKAAHIRPSSVTYGAIINACCRVGDAESAATLFEEMSNQPNFKPRVPPFNTMMQFHLQTRPSRERVLYYHNAMRSAGVRPSAHTYKLLLDAYGTLAPIDLPSMDRVFGELCADRFVAVQGTHWASLITAFGIHNSDVDRATAIFDAIPNHPSTRRGTLPEPVVWEALLNVLGQKGSLEALEEVRTRMIESGVRPTAYVHNVLINGYSRHSAIDKAREVFEAMGDSLTGVAAPNNHPALLTSSGHVKPATVTSEPSGTVYREPSTYEAMIRAELAAGNREAAEAILSRMEARRYPVAVWMKARAILDEAV